MTDGAKACLGCQAPLISGPIGRPKTKYCSRKCKEAGRTRRQPTRVHVDVEERTCVACATAFQVSAGSPAKTCSRACGVTYQNRRKQAAKRAEWEANKPPCGKCGGEIPDERPRGSKFCSVPCKRRAMGDRYRERNPLYQRLYRYGVTAEQYEALIDAQAGLCAICRTAEPGGKGGWHVDHCHETGKVRGLLCHHCNIAIGYFKDDPALIRAGIDYVARVQTVQAA